MTTTTRRGFFLKLGGGPTAAAALTEARAVIAQPKVQCTRRSRNSRRW
jgi:hypothetical protein